jgi:hypothetical protein
MRTRGLVVAALVLTWVMCVRADEWPAPRVQNVFSADGQYFVRIVPATAVSSATRTAGPSNQGKSHGEFYRRQPDRSYRLVADVELRNRVSPTYAVVTDDGYLVTFDDWYQMGIGDVLAFYRPTGALIRAVTIEDLYTPARLLQIPRSVSSRQWRCGVFYTPPTKANPESLTVFEHFGGSFQLSARTGTFEYRAGTAPCSPGQATIFR